MTQILKLRRHRFDALYALLTGLGGSGTSHSETGA